MAVELWSRIHGSSVDWWLARPFSFALYTYRHLQEIDRRHAWQARMHRIESGHLTAAAMHEPGRIETERRAAIAQAAPEPPETTEQLREIGLRMARTIEDTGVLR